MDPSKVSSTCNSSLLATNTNTSLSFFRMSITEGNGDRTGFCSSFHSSPFYFPSVRVRSRRKVESWTQPITYYAVPQTTFKLSFYVQKLTMIRKNVEQKCNITGKVLVTWPCHPDPGHIIIILKPISVSNGRTKLARVHTYIYPF